MRERAEMSLETPSPSGDVFDRLTILAAAYPCPRANSPALAAATPIADGDAGVEV